MPKHIGIVAMSPEGSSFCYRLIGRRASEIDAPEQRPLITLHNQPFSTYVELLEDDDWAAIAQLLSDSASTLATAGADFCVLPDNVAHHALPLAEPASPIPFLNMIDLVADALQGNGGDRVGLIGTKWVTYGSTYQTALGLRGMHLLVPPEDEADAIDKIIFREAVYGQVRPESQQRVLEAITALANRGCEALILGTTEASLLMALEENPLPVFDPVELLAEAAVRHAVGQDLPAAQPARTPE